MSKERKYIEEIDGLRAFAVIGVLLYHFELGLPGGFIGVDVFLVISGFLITNIITKDLESGEFSLKRFFQRRVRRLVPASVVVVFGCFVAGFLIIDPHSLVGFSKTVVAYALFASNIFFSRGNGYFAESSDLMPLLHTWSLSLEEQFYFILPIVLLVLFRRSRKILILVLIVIGIASLVSSELFLKKTPGKCFFLLHFRLWEFIPGVLLALFYRRVKITGPFADVVLLAGLAMIVAPMFVYHSLTPFPGVSAIPPVMGAAMVIWVVVSSKSRASWILRVGVIRGIGLISYSLYLWHWPILSFFRHLVIEPTSVQLMVLAFLSIVVAVLSWRFIEMPFRKPGVFVKKVDPIVAAIVVSMASVGMGFVFIYKDGLPGRFDQETLEMVGDISWNGSEYLSEQGVGVKLGAEGIEGERIDFVLLGDSHGMMVCRQFDLAAKRQGLVGRAFVESGLVPVPGLWKPEQGKDELERHKNFHGRILRELNTLEPKAVILVSRWTALCSGITQDEVEDEKQSGRSWTLVASTESDKVVPEESPLVLSQALNSFVEQLSSMSIDVHCLGPVPECRESSCARNFYQIKRAPRLNDYEFPTIKLEEYTQRSEEAIAALKRVTDQGFTIHNVGPAFFDRSGFLPIVSERSYYRDNDHLTDYGVKVFLSEYIENMLIELEPETFHQNKLKNEQ